MMKTHSVRTNRLLFGLFVMMGLLTACREAPKRASGTSHLRLTDEKLISYNRGVVKTEEQEIMDFVSRYGWDIKQSATGLRYLIYKKGEGIQAKTGMIAHFLYTIRLLDGTLAYSSDSLGEKSIVLGHGGVESGLEEGMLLLHEGDQAKFIIPSYLAHGVLGDQAKIPPGATLVYDVHLLKLETNKK